MKPKICILSFIALGFALHNAIFAQTDEEISNAQRNFYIGVFYSRISQPTFHPPESGSLVVDQTIYSPGFLAGYKYNFKFIGLGGRIILWHSSFEDFTAKEMPGTSVYLDYTDPKLTTISFDLIPEFILSNKFYFGIYGLLGFGSSMESFTISGSTFPEWDGQKSTREFDFSFGFGIKVSPVKWVTAIGELRWHPGDYATEYTYSSGSGWDKTSEGIVSYMSIFSVGLSFNFGNFFDKNK